MATRSLLYKTEVPITEQISIQIPTVHDVLENEDEYYHLVSLLTAMPIDLMVVLDDAGVDFTKINEYQLFIILFKSIQTMNTSMIFGNLDLSGFEYAVDDKNGMPVYIDREKDIVIDRTVQYNIADTLRKIHHLEKNVRKPGNDEAKKYMLERARKKLRRNRNKNKDSYLESLIIAMVNTEQYHYGFEGTRELSIYQFNESVRQVIKKVDYDNRMFGIYSGTVSPKDLSQDELNWLIHK